MALWIHDSGALTTDIERGVRAAEQAFVKFGWRPRIVWQAMEEDCDSLENGAAEHCRVAKRIWRQAEAAAFRETFEGWHRIPDAASLVWEEKTEE